MGVFHPIVATQHRRRLFPDIPDELKVHSLAAGPIHPRLAFRCKGQGPVLVLIPDICSAAPGLDEVGDSLEKELCVVRPQSSGAHLVAVLARQGSIRAAALAVGNALEATAGRGATIVGEGAGGLIAAELAELAPWVQRLALVDTPLSEDALNPPTSGAPWHVRRRWSGVCRRFLRESDPLLDRLRGIDRPTLVVQDELHLMDWLKQPGPGGGLRLTSARDSRQLADAIASFADPSRRRQAQRFQHDSRRSRSAA